MKTKLEKVQENLAISIGKLITRALLNASKQIKQFRSDPEFDKLIKSAKFHADEYERKMEKRCKKFPDAEDCKEYLNK